MNLIVDLRRAVGVAATALEPGAQPPGRDKAAAREAFKGGKTPVTDEARAPVSGLRPWLVLALLSTCLAAQAQGTSAGVAKDAAAAIPSMQPGQWKLRTTVEGRTKENETCGDPIGGFRREVQEYAANTRWGCTMNATATGPRGAKVVYDCPNDRSPDGRPVTKGRSEIVLESPSPQAFRMEMTSTAYPGYRVEGTRVGDCAK